MNYTEQKAFIQYLLHDAVENASFFIVLSQSFPIFLGRGLFSDQYKYSRIQDRLRIRRSYQH